jgi:GT2 family glycosyltransferase
MISLILVNYHSAALAATAISSARAASSVPLQVIAVDNSVDPAEAKPLRECADVVIVSETNRGYAGAINDGRRVARGEILLVANPDVVFAESAIDRLLDGMGSAAAAGPALFWDDRHEWRLPPADVQTTAQKLDAMLASRSAAWAEAHDRRRTRRRIAFWESSGVTEVETISGAVMALRAADFDALSGFDERFALYFEETDFLRRLRERRRRVVHVADAKCRHLFNQSAGRDLRAAGERYGQSEFKYYEKWSGPFVARFIRRFQRHPIIRPFEPFPGVIELDRDDVVIEASPLPAFQAAAGHVPTSRTIELPPEVLTSLRHHVLYIRVVDRESGEVLKAWEMAASQ